MPISLPQEYEQKLFWENIYRPLLKEKPDRRDINESYGNVGLEYLTTEDPFFELKMSDLPDTSSWKNYSEKSSEILKEAYNWLGPLRVLKADLKD